MMLNYECVYLSKNLNWSAHSQVKEIFQASSYLQELILYNIGLAEKESHKNLRETPFLIQEDDLFH